LPNIGETLGSIHNTAKKERWEGETEGKKKIPGIFIYQE
jgi:hypothetical protein